MENSELQSVLLERETPSAYFEALRQRDALLPQYAELQALIGIPQDPEHHPEGDVWTHTVQVLDRAARLRERASDPLSFMLLALTHDLGKAVTTERLDDGRWHSYGHETQGVSLAERLLRRNGASADAIKYVKNMLPLHMKPKISALSGASEKSTNRMFAAAASPEDLLLMSYADKPVPEADGFLRERLQSFRALMAKPFLTADELTAAGVSEARLPAVLAYANKLRLAKIDAESALRQCLAYARKLK